ncbi:MAG: adenylate kinase [Eubacteriales bacterium]|nr:adenylate kinase [Eubacteriales bacterium]
MEKVMVIGCPGSGKSTLSIELSRITRLPLYHLDMMYWNSDRTTVEKSVFLQRLQQVLKEDRWIIDGNYASTMEMRMQCCDTVIFLDYPTDICFEGVRSRRGKPRADMPWIESEDEEDSEFMELISNYNDVNRPHVLNLLDQYQTKNIVVLHNREQAKIFLNEKSGEYRVPEQGM